MKNKNILKIIIVLFIVFIPNVIKAEKLNISNVCESVAANGDIISCQVRLYGNKNILLNEIEGNIILPESFIFDHYEKGNYITLAKTNDIHFSFSSSVGVPNEMPIFTYYIKVNSGYDEENSNTININFDKIVIGELEFNDYDIESNIIKLDSFHESKLDSLEIEGLELSPKFNPTVQVYKVTTEEESINISATLKDLEATTNINDLENYTVNLDYGVNNIYIKVTARDRSSRTYKIIATRNDNRSDEAKLQLLSVDGIKIDLKKDVFDYQINVNYDTENANLLYTPISSTATIEVLGNTSLKVGENTLMLAVTSEKGTTSKYMLTINRLDRIKSSDATIKNLEITNISDNNFNFKTDNQNYIIKVPKNISSLNFKIELNDINATYEIIDNNDLKNYSKVYVKVTAEDDTEATYSFLIEKAKDNSSLFIIIGLMIVLIILVTLIIVYIIIYYKNNNQNNNNSDNNDDIDLDSNIEDDFENTLIDGLEDTKEYNFKNDN